MRRTFRRLAVAATLGAVAIAGAEIFLQLRSAALQRPREPVNTRQRIGRAYEPCTEQHAHPHYVFFFPLDPADRLALGNAVCSLDADGFREPGPRHAGNRKLAFLLGGSAAFGDMATSNDQTITSHLNRLQQEYFFVNAGVPSWNSTQQLMRLALDIVDRKPALVIAYDGANDAVLAGQIRPRTNSPYPPGTPEFFDALETMIDERSEPWLRRLHPRRMLPEIALRIDKLFEAPPVQVADDDGEVADEDIASAVRRYRANHARMAELSQAAGARFIAVFQPVANLHQNADAREIGRRPLMEKFHREAMAVVDPAVDVRDFSRLFERFAAEVGLAGPNLDDDALFVDLVHLTDRGNAIVAEELWRLIGARADSPPRP